MLHDILKAVILPAGHLELGSENMPFIDDAINHGPLGGSERGVMRAVEHHNRHIWSTSPEDLAELAIWTAEPNILTPERFFPDTPMDQNTVIEYQTKRGTVTRPVMAKTYKLSTIRWALSRLAKKRLIAAFELHNRRYYGSYEALNEVGTKIGAMSQADLDRSGFSPGTTEDDSDAGDELGDEATFDSIGKP